jgi:hypothetical protein
MVITNWLSLIYDPIWLTLAVIGLALTAAWTLWRTRPVRPPQASAPPAAPAGRETATRLDLPVSAEVGGFLEVLSGDDTLLGKLIPLYQHTTTTAGRSLEQAELVFNLHREISVVSRLHCEFDEVNGVFRVRDLASTQGTFLNGMRLPVGGEGQVLLDGDRLELGPAERGGVVLRFHSASIRLVRQLLQ